jgi:hypothetical protein
MDYEKTLPATGLGALTIGGVVTDQLWLPLVALVIVLLAATVLRLAFRRKKSPFDA